MADNKDKKVLKSSIEREQSQTCLNSAEREKIKGSTNLNVPHLRFPEFSGEWESARLSSFAKKITKKNKGNTISNILCNSANFGIIPQSEYFDRDIANSENTATYYIVESGDFVYNPRKSVTSPYGPVNMYKGKNLGIISPLYLCFSVKGISKEYLLNWFKGNKWYRYVYSHGDMGVRYDRVSIKDDIFFHMPINVPNIDEQEKISKILNLIDKRIATQNKIIEKLESLIKGLSQRLLSPKQGWTSYKLDELCQIKSGYSGIQVSFQTAYKVSRIETISNHCINMSRIGFVKEIPQEYKLSVGDILFSNINSVQYIGNTAFIDKDYGLYHGMNLLRIVPDSRIVFPRFIHLLLCSERLLRHFQSICNKAVSQASINQTSLGKTIMTIPSYKEQQHICSIIESVERKLDIETSLLKMLQYQKQYLLRQMFI